MLNKSLVTNVIAIMCLILGFYSPIGAERFQAVGLFAFSGAITNWLAVYMLFEKVPLLYGSGVVPSRYEEFKLGIRSLVMNQFFTAENIKRFLGESTATFDPTVIASSIDYDLLFKKLVESVLESPLGGMLSMLGGPSALDSVKPHFDGKVKEALLEIMNSPELQAKLQSAVGGNGGSDLSQKIEAIVEQRLDELTPKMVKEIVQEMIQKHLGWLVVWGGVFGGLIGLLTTFF